MSEFTTLRDKLEALVESGATAVEALFAPILAELTPMAEADLKVAAQAGVTAALGAIAGGPVSMTLTGVEAAIVAGARAAAASAVTSGKQLTVQAATGLVVAVGLTVPALVAPATGG